MALKIKVTTETTTGFEVPKAFIFLDFYFLRNQTWVNLTYFQSQTSFNENKESYQPEGLPTQISYYISANEFWGDDLIMFIHNICITEIEKIVGVGNVEIIEDPAA